MIPEKLQHIVRKYAMHPEFIGIEIEDVNQPGAVDDTLLHIAARTGQLEEIKLLLSCGADINRIGDLGNTPLHQAALTGQLAAVQVLLKAGANPRIRNEFEETAADVAQQGGHEDVFQLLRK